MVVLDRVGSDNLRIQTLREAKRDDSSLVLCNFDISVEVAGAVRDLLRLDPFDRTWDVEILGLDLTDTMISSLFSQALAGKISSIKMHGEFYPHILSQISFENLSETLKHVSLGTLFEIPDVYSMSNWLMQLTSLESLSLQQHQNQKFLEHFFTAYAPTSQLRKLCLEDFTIHSEMIGEIKDWQNLEDLSFIMCDFYDPTTRIHRRFDSDDDSSIEFAWSMGFVHLTHLQRVEVSFHQLHHLTELISHPGCQLKIVDAHRFVIHTPRVSSKQTEELIKALEKNKTIEAFHTYSEQFDMTFSPYVKRNLVYNKLIHHSVNIPAGLWPHILELFARIPIQSADTCDAFYLVFRHGGYLAIKN